VNRRQVRPRTSVPAEEVNPDPRQMVESLRDFGYTLPSALADLIDNSLTAGAKHIEVVIDAEPGPSGAFVAVLDDGTGMDKQTLVEAMRMGTTGPLALRPESDLGRFGLGLKTASLSQGRCLTVATRTVRDNAPVTRRWDIGHIQKTGRWQLLEDPTPAAEEFVRKLSGMSSGTAVVVEELDRATFLKVSPHQVDEHLGQVLQAVREHLAMVFHRFIEDGVEIKVGATPLMPWDPFLRGKSGQLPEERLILDGQVITVVPFVLPHHSKLSDDEHVQAGGPRGWNEHQGFYIYRGRRLIVPGTWLNLGLRKEEHFKLARIRVDLPNSLDSEWQLNVMKSHVAAPAVLRDDFRRIASEVRRQASAVYRYRGEKVTPTQRPPERFVWKREQGRTGVRYRIDRTHPVVQALLHGGCEHGRDLGNVLDLVEKTIPIASMLQDPPKALDGSVEVELPGKLDQYAEMLVHAEQFLIRAGRTPSEARETVLLAEPFIRYREELRQRLEARSSGEGNGSAP
jgi:Histidine kinase-, DNA gyrase B-, and HSP90-like ATPase